jgi:hypothetical protein
MPPMIAPLLTAGIGGLIGGLGSKDKNKQQQQSQQSSTENVDRTMGSRNLLNQFGQSDQRTSQAQNINQTTAPVFSGNQSGIQGDLYGQLHSALSNPFATSPLFNTLFGSMRNSAVGGLNQAYDGAQAGLTDQLASRGFGRSGMAPANLQALQSQRLGGIGSLQNSLAGQQAGMQLDQYNKTLQQALQYAFAAPGQHTTGANTTTGTNFGTTHEKGLNTGTQHILGTDTSQGQSSGMSSGQQGGNAAAGALTGIFGGLNAQPGGFGGFVNSIPGMFGQGQGGISSYSLPQSSNAPPYQGLPNLDDTSGYTNLGGGGLQLQGGGLPFIH